MAFLIVFDPLNTNWQRENLKGREERDNETEIGRVGLKVL